MKLTTWYCVIFKEEINFDLSIVSVVYFLIAVLEVLHNIVHGNDIFNEYFEFISMCGRLILNLY